MIKLILFLSLFFLIASCTEKTKIIHHDARFETEFYSVLDYVLQNRFSDASVVESETDRIFRSHWGNTKHPTGHKAVPPPFVVYYSYNDFQKYIDSMYLSSAESISMLTSIDSTTVIFIDSGRIVLPVIPTFKLKEIFTNKEREEGYNIIERNYGGRCFIKASTPVFNSDFTKSILSIGYFCGGLTSYGFQFLLEKKENGWKILNEESTWGT